MLTCSFSAFSASTSTPVGAPNVILMKLYIGATRQHGHATTNRQPATFSKPVLPSDQAISMTTPMITPMPTPTPRPVSIPMNILSMLFTRAHSYSSFVQLQGGHMSHATFNHWPSRARACRRWGAEDSCYGHSGDVSL